MTWSLHLAGSRREATPIEPLTRGIRAAERGNCGDRRDGRNSAPRQSFVELQHAAQRPGQPALVAPRDQPLPTRRGRRGPPRHPRRNRGATAGGVDARGPGPTSRDPRSNPWSESHLVVLASRPQREETQAGRLRSHRSCCFRRASLSSDRRLRVKRWFHERPPPGLSPTSTPMTIARKLFHPARMTWVMWMTKKAT